jgi:hypothetical protein
VKYRARKLRQVNQKNYADVITALNLKDSPIEKINLNKERVAKEL